MQIKHKKGVGKHKCPKQVSLLVELLLRYSVAKDLVLDVFLGSGSMLIAAEKTNRRCFGIEIDEKYTQVILERWSAFTGKDPVREDGVKFSELKKAEA